TPCFQYPAGHGLAPARRGVLLARAADAGTAVFEDDYDSEFRDDSQPRPALASAAASQGATVLHAGTFSKLMFPAVRLGWIVLPAGHLPAAMGVMRSLGGGHNAVQQRAVASLLDDGTVARHLVRARAEYGRRRRALIYTLAHSPLRCVTAVAA
ncbi:MAG: aminotransferase class I/II-fold pyridoxal phosphate-dependent enzyme, partial [Pseudomonadota bacterium]